MSIEFRVFGMPAAQGSKRHVGNGVMIESSKKVKPWRQDVVAAALEAIEQHHGFERFTGPVCVRVTFFLPRPKSHYRTGAHAGELKPGAPVYVATKPDADKLLRSTLDAISTSGCWMDDNQAARIVAEKRYDTLPGAYVSLTPLAVTA